MTAIQDHCNTIREWLNFEYSDELITSWTRMAEEDLSERLRCKHMVALDVATITQNRVLLPTDWLELDFVAFEDGGPLIFVPRHDFYSQGRPNCPGRYTITGNYLIVGGDVTGPGQRIELSYYESIPPLGDDPNWLMRYYSRLYVVATLAAASAYSIEDERAVTWQAAVQDMVDTINAGHQKSKTSGSLMIQPRRKKGFG